ERNSRSEPQALGSPGPKALDDDVCTSDQLQRDLDAVRGLQVKPDRPLTSRREVSFGTSHLSSGDLGDRRPMVSKHHPCERDRADATKLDDGQAFEWSGHLVISPQPAIMSGSHVATSGKAIITRQMTNAIGRNHPTEANTSPSVIF